MDRDWFRSSGRAGRALLLLLALGLAACEDRSAAYALTSGGQLIGFDVQSPATITSTVAPSGLATGDSLARLAYRPADGGFYASSSQNRLYKIDPATGIASEVGSSPYASAALSAPVAAFDPVRDQLRLLNASVNLRVSAADGSLAASDMAAVYATGDSNAGQTPSFTALTYVPLDGTPATAYALDATTQSLVTLGSVGGNPQSADGGSLLTVAKLGIAFTINGGLSRQPDGDTLYAALATSTTGASLYKLNVTDGSSELVDTVGDGSYTVVSLAVGTKRRISTANNAASTTTGTSTGSSTTSGITYTYSGS